MRFGAGAGSSGLQIGQRCRKRLWRQNCGTGQAATVGTPDACVKAAWGSLPAMLALSAFSSTFGLLITFGGLGIVVNGLIVYIVAQALGERAENRREASGDETTRPL